MVMDSQTITDLDNRKAREYLMLPSSYCTVNLPGYFDFTKILKFVRKVVGRKDITTCLVLCSSVCQKHPNSGIVARLLSSLLNRLGKIKLKDENMKVLISITVEIMMTSPRVFNVGTALISFFLNKIEDGKDSVVKDVYHKLHRMSNTGESEIWLQRITCHLNDVEIAYEEPLTELVKGNEVQLWNNVWLKPELLVDFPILSICDTAIRDAQTPVIAPKEVSIFDY